MKITSVNATPVSIPLTVPLRWATGCMESFNHVLIRIMTDEGIEGIAEAIPRESIYGETQASITAIVNEFLGPRILGLDPFDTEKIHDAMNFIVANLAAKGGIDVAIHDIIGKKLGMPCHKLLGGHKDRVPVCWSITLKSMDMMVQEVIDGVAKGIRAFKVKGGIDPDFDIELIRKMREVSPKGTILYIDGNQSYTRSGALKVLNTLGDQLDYCEEPLRATDTMGRMQLAEKIKTPILGDESVFTIFDVARQIEMGVVGIVMLKIPRNGFTYGKKIAALCEAYYKPMMIGTQAETGLGAITAAHLGCALKQVVYPCELMDHLHAKGSLIYEQPRIEDGYLYVPDGPGLGVTLDEDSVKKFTVSV